MACWFFLVSGKLWFPQNNNSPRYNRPEKNSLRIHYWLGNNDSTIGIMIFWKAVITITVKFEHCNASRIWIGNTHIFCDILFYSSFLATAKMIHHVWNDIKRKSYPDECKGTKTVSSIWHFLNVQTLNLSSKVVFYGTALKYRSNLKLLFGHLAMLQCFIKRSLTLSKISRNSQNLVNMILFWYKPLTLRPLLNVDTGNVVKL